MDIPPPKPKQNLGRKRGVKQEKRVLSVAVKAKQAAKRVIKKQDDKIRKANMVIMKFINTINKILYTIEEDNKYYISDQENFNKRITEESYHELNK